MGAETMRRNVERTVRAAPRAVVIALALVVVAAGCGDSTEKTTPTTTTTTAVGSTTTTAGPGRQPAVWPPDAGSVSYDDPVAAATAFATEFVGFTDPVVSEFQGGDSKSGEVEVRAKAGGPVTTVFLRQIGTDTTWSVIGAATDNIQLSEPALFAKIATPVQLRGMSTAFEGTVQVAVRDRSGGSPLGEGFVTGGSQGTLGPFDSTLAFSTPATTEGAIVLYTVSAEDGRVSEAAVLSIGFSSGG